MGVYKRGMRRLDSTPMRMRVTNRPPTQEATSGAMLSREWFVSSDIQSTEKESYLDRG